ncbi:MAG TPA: hypothetical protein VEV17_21115 [Bryobacteraceae bacterium]|nr:hypothetical protein [Bryobacteraceae bacterium]
MKITAMVAMAMAAGFGGSMAQAADQERTVAIYIANEHVAVEAANFGKGQASKMFARIGVRVQWHSVGRSPLPADALVVDMVERGSKDECAGALACAKPYEGIHIRVFVDRLGATVPKNMVPALLGHVLVHEITHILQGVDRHSDSGVMKARWDVNDFEQMLGRTLPFTGNDVMLIERGLDARESRLASVVAAKDKDAAQAGGL